MIEVYKTDLNDLALAEEIKRIVEQEVQHCKISFDLEDKDRIMRVQAEPAGIAAAEELFRLMLVVFEPLPA